MRADYHNSSDERFKTHNYAVRVDETDHIDADTRYASLSYASEMITFPDNEKDVEKLDTYKTE